MKKDEMTSSERIKATLRREETDRIPFWPKLSATYARFQKDAWARRPIPEMHAEIGSDVASYTGLRFNLSPHGEISMETETAGSEQRVRYGAKNRVMIARAELTEEAGDSHPTEYPIKDYEDLVAMIEFYKKAEWKVDEKSLELHRAQMRQQPDGFYMASMDATPLMELCQYKLGLENTVYFLYDYPDEMEELIDAMHRDYLNKLRLLCENIQSGYILCVENTSTTLISPHLFEKYCLPQLCMYGEIIQSFGKEQILHMCGKLKAILPMIAQTPACAMEAFTSPTVGDTSIADGFCELPGKAIIGGTCASTWLLSREAIIARILGDIKEAGGTRGLYLTSAGVMPFSADVEKIRDVWRGVRDALYGG